MRQIAVGRRSEGVQVDGPRQVLCRRVALAAAKVQPAAKAAGAGAGRLEFDDPIEVPDRLVQSAQFGVQRPPAAQGGGHARLRGYEPVDAIEGVGGDLDFIQGGQSIADLLLRPCQQRLVAAQIQIVNRRQPAQSHRLPRVTSARWS